MRLVGVDGCRAGWVVAASELSVTDGAPLSAPIFGLASTFGQVLAAFGGMRALVAVDIPIGLPSGTPVDRGRRRADEEARRFLGPGRAVSVFSTPCRGTLRAGSYREACEVEVAARGAIRGLSQQAFRIIPKIRDVDEVVTPRHQETIALGPGLWVREVHPEVTFAALAGRGQAGHGLVHSKRGCKRCHGRDCPGERERLALLRHYVPDLEPRMVQARLLADHRQAGRRGAVVGRDDVVDAVACLVTAFRIATGRELTLPAGAPEYDARGLRMEIVA
jgi:predicted RNase H-like nuclease